ncbi:MAG: PilZ domain-containing protein [Candidatus Omnitrophica bacterium]|nr:PilZ domain-containing protein [Candidatus Omnitrophota bacterium]
MEINSLSPKNKNPGNIEHRKYIRLNVVFPVEFQFIDAETAGSISDIKQGFTRDISKSGICLEVNNLEEGLDQVIKEGRAKLDIRFHIPLSMPETKATAKIVWHEKIKSGYPNKYLIGLSFLKIDPKDSNRIYFHATRVILTPAIIAVLFFFLVSGISYFYYTGFKSKADNIKLVKEMNQLSTKKSELEKNLLALDKEHEVVGCKIVFNEDKIEEYKTQIKDLEKIVTDTKTKDKLILYLENDKEKTKKIMKRVLYQRARFNQKMKDLDRENVYLKNRVSRLSNQKISTEDNLKDLLASFNAIEEKNISSMYQWIKNNQNRNTGLVMSYEGDKDLEEAAFTYDQSLSSQCFTLVGDQENAKGILDFYRSKAEKSEGAFANAYNPHTGKIAEYYIHSGPNIWLGIAIAQYTQKFKDDEYLTIAEDIAKWLIALQEEDKNFGIRGGPEFKWFSTEHNLDAYALFGMLYNMTEDDKYLEAQNRALDWLKKSAFNRLEYRLNRGKGDATIATDTFAWAIAAIGPQLLKESGMDPEQIMDFAETNCMVTADYARQDGERVKVTGFDFGKYEHMTKGGIVSTEWTSQMIVSFNVMADYYKKNGDFNKVKYYNKKADFYFSEIEKMIVSSPSKVGQGQSCLPYSTQDDVDTGHGWRITHGTKTGSTAGTAYAIFAKYNYNPLILE